MCLELNFVNYSGFFCKKQSNSLFSLNQFNFQVFPLPLGWWATQLSFSKLFLPKVAPRICYFKHVSRNSGAPIDIGYLSPLVSPDMSIVHATNSIQVRVTLWLFDHTFGRGIFGEIRNLQAFLFEVLQSLWGIVEKQRVGSLSVKTAVKCKTCWCCMKLPLPHTLINPCKR